MSAAGGIQTWWVELPAGPVLLGFVLFAALSGQAIGWCVLKATARTRTTKPAPNMQDNAQIRNSLPIRPPNSARRQQDSVIWTVYR